MSGFPSGWPPPILIPFHTMLPVEAFQNLINKTGISVLWLKGHLCPCTGDTGSSDPTSTNLICPVCFGRGVYYDPPIGPYTVLMTWISFNARNVDIGQEQDAQYGLIIEAHPILTIPNTTGAMWQNFSEYDAIVEVDATMKFNTILHYNEQTMLPAWHFSSFSIASSGAVIVEDPALGRPVSGAAYSVSGLDVTLNATWDNGTAYTVEYYSAPVYIAYERYGGMPHVRPFQHYAFPRRFKVSLLDLWTRDKLGSSTNIS